MTLIFLNWLLSPWGTTISGVEVRVSNQDIIESLKQIGFSDSASKIYLLLLQKSNCTASEISKITGISRSKTYEHLSRLVNAGMCTEILGSVKKYALSNPTIAFKDMQRKLKLNYEKDKTIISDLSKIFLPLYNAPNENTHPLDYIQVIREKKSIIKKFETLEKMAEKEILSLVKAPLAMDLTEPHNLTEYNSLKKGVTIKTIYNTEDMNIPLLVKSIETFEREGEQVRVVDKFPIPFKLYIFDERIVMFSLEDKIVSNSNLTALIIEHLDLAKGLKEVFNIYWNNSIIWEEFKRKINV
ncbi:MAG: helix-turn-helix domain-containing protein [Candidatus Tenebribacter burtonii]|nr:helix-turn-helix domain-containing protein [Candidatus Tenebribacter burtonii]